MTLPAQTTPPPCACCGEPATREDAEGVPLCEGDYLHLVEHWREFEADHEVANRPKSPV